MRNDLRRVLEQAAQFHTAGDIVSAEAKYREVLAECAPDPANSELQTLAAWTNFNLAFLAEAAGQPVRALTHYRVALDAKAAQPAWWLAYGATLAQVGRTTAAKEALEQGKKAGADIAQQEQFIHPCVDLVENHAPALIRMLPTYAAGSAGGDFARAELALSCANSVLGLMGQLAAGNGLFAGGTQRIEDMGRDPASVSAKARLAELFNQHGSDKSRKKHNYHELYGYILRDPDSISAVLEIGLGTNNTDVVSNVSKRGRPGASLRAFRDFLPRATIFGADFDSRILFTEERIKTFFVDQTDQATLEALAEDIPGEMDLIIDDGLHAPDANLATLIFGLRKIKPGGWVVVEDIIPAALPVWRITARLLPPGFSSRLFRAKSSFVFAVQRQ